MKLSKLLVEEGPFIFACPALMWQIIFLCIPLIVLIFHSLTDISSVTHSYFFTFFYYKKVFDSLYIYIIFHSFMLALWTAIICLLIAYPVAFYFAITKRAMRFRSFLLFSLILPSWTSLIIQIYAWFFLLEKNGLVSQLLKLLGLLKQSEHLLNNYFSIYFGMISCYLPFMILPLYAILEKMDKQYLEASADLGASRFETFRRIIFPLSLPGIYTGFFLVFIPAFGEYAIPTLLGGSKYLFWGNVIVDKFLKSQSWGIGSASAIIGILFPLLLAVIFYLFITCIRFFKKNRKKMNQLCYNTHDIGFGEEGD